MANTASAEKRIRQTAKAQERNRARRSTMRTAIKQLRTAVTEGDADTARQLLPTTCGIIDRSAQKGILHANAAARTKARLSKAVSALG